MQLAVPHDTVVGACWQPPAPLHAPVFPHGALDALRHWPAGAASPDGMLAQVPALPATLQALQVPHEADAQQTPSTQVRPARQSEVALQLCPWWLRPHTLAWQWFPAAQSASFVQAVLQLVPLQA